MPHCKEMSCLCILINSFCIPMKQESLMGLEGYEREYKMTEYSLLGEISIYMCALFNLWHVYLV